MDDIRQIKLPITIETDHLNQGGKIARIGNSIPPLSIGAFPQDADPIALTESILIGTSFVVRVIPR